MGISNNNKTYRMGTKMKTTTTATNTTTTTKEHTMQTPNITVIDNDSQEIHVHATGCRDIARSAKKLATYGPSRITDYASHLGAAEDFLGDVATDEHDYGSEEWKDAVMLEWKASAHIHSCAKS